MPNKNNPQLTGSEILWATLVGEGVTTVFGYPGGAILPIYDALRKFCCTTSSLNTATPETVPAQSPSPRNS